MLAYSADTKHPRSQTSSSQNLCVSDATTLDFNKSEEASNSTCENTRETLKETPSGTSSTASTTTMSNQDLRGQLQCQLHLEMQKKRPDHFVIGVTCRSLGGVPSELRAQVWKELLGVAQSEQLSLDQYILQVEEDLENQRVITVDATRTRSTEPRFKQPETIELVIKLLTYYCKCHKIQYKQGMNEVLAPFLLLTEEREGCDGHVPLSEGVVYQCFDALIDKFLPHVFQDKEFRSLQCSFQLYRLLMLYHDPTLCHYLDQHHMTPELYVTPWFMTLFARSLRPDFVFYLWDFFLLEEDPYLLHFVAYALVAANRKQIFRAEIALLPQVLSSLTFSSRHELERVCVNALAISESTPRSFKRDLYSVCYGGFTDAMVPLLDQLNASSSLQVYPDELIRNLLDRLTTKSKRKRSSVSSLPAPVNLEEPTDSNKPLYSPESDQTTLEDESESDDGTDEVTALKFLVLDCRPVEEYHKSHLSLSHHIDPNITERPEELETLMKGFLQMKGCHFCFVGPSLETPPLLSRSTSNNAALNTIARLASVISSDKSQHLATQDTSPRPMKFADGEVVVGDVLPSGKPATLTRTMSRGEPGSLATEISSNGASTVHEEHVLVTRLVLTFLQKGFKYVSRLDGGFLELEKSIRSMDTFSQEQLLISSPEPLPVCQDQGFANAVASSSGGFNLFAKMGLGRSNVVFQDDEATRRTLAKGFDGSRYRFTRTATFSSSDMTSSRVMKDAQQEKKRKSRLKSTSSAAVSTLSQRLMHLRAATKKKHQVQVRWMGTIVETLQLLATLQARMEAQGMESVMNIVHSKRTVKLNPSVQHIPVDPSNVHLRPPPAKIPKSFNIFVGISVFRDGFRCGKTIFTGIKRAKYPDRLYFGVVDQVITGDERCLDAYCKMAEVEWPDKGPCPYKEHVRVDVHTASESRGPTLARYHQQKLIQQEEFCLQLDGHSIFTNLWDENLLADWKRVNNEMAVLSTYLHHMHDFVKDNGDNALSPSLPHLCTTIRGHNGLVRTSGASMIKNSKFPQLQALWGASLSFSKCHAERRVRVDSHTLWMFDGEEFMRASRLWTSGYDIYSPSLMGSFIYHNYSKVPVRFEHITVKKRESEMAINRFNHLVGKPVKGLIDTFELDKYGFGSVRSFLTYLKFCCVSFEVGVNDTESCEQLHWVPYENATEVEALMGNGWKLYGVSADPNLRRRADLEIGLVGIDKMKTTQHTEEPAVINDEPNAEIVEQVAITHTNNDTGSGEAEEVEKMEVQLRHKVLDDPSVTGPSAAPVWFLLFVVVAAIFGNISNDRVSRLIRKKLCSAPRSHSSSD